MSPYLTLPFQVCLLIEPIYEKRKKEEDKPNIQLLAILTVLKRKAKEKKCCGRNDKRKQQCLYLNFVLMKCETNCYL